MDIELYVCEGEIKDTSSIYIPDFTHHEHHNLSSPEGGTWTTIAQLKEEGFKLLKEVDITPRPNINDTEPPTIRSLLVFGID